MSHRGPEYPDTAKLPMEFPSHRRSPSDHYTVGDQPTQGYSYQRWPDHPPQYSSISSHPGQHIPSTTQNDHEYPSFTSTRAQTRSDPPLNPSYTRWEAATPNFPPAAPSQYNNASVMPQYIKSETHDNVLRASHPSSPETSQSTGYHPSQSPSTGSHLRSYEYHAQYYASYTTPNFPSPPPSSSTSSSRPSPPDERSTQNTGYPITTSSSPIKQQHHSLPTYYGSHSTAPSRGRSWTTSTAADLSQSFVPHHSGSHDNYSTSTSANTWSSNADQQHLRHRSYPVASPAFPPQSRDEDRRSGPVSIPQNPASPSAYSYSSQDVASSFASLESPPNGASGNPDDLHDPPSSTTPPVKPKRKRADATQLRVLNEVYARTAFPSTEERAELAKRLNMSPRQVQIWFQNRRQNARQSRANSNAAQYPPVGDAPGSRSNTSPERPSSVLYGSYNSSTGDAMAQDALPYPNYPPMSDDHRQMGPPSYQKGH